MSMSRRSATVIVTIVAGCTFALYAADERASSGDADLQFQLANLLFDETRYQEALQAFDRATRTDDQVLAVRARKGKVRTALRVAEFELARHEAELLRTQASTDPEAMTLLGDALWSVGLFDEADRRYSDTLAQTPGSSRARFGLARSLATKSRLDEALREALAASAASPRDG